jgi:hypothetical protein
MAKSFLFITPLTPSRLLTPLRKLLFEEYLKALKAQSYSNWNALLIGEENRSDGKIQYVSVKAESKEIKLIFAKEYVITMDPKPDYIIRLDDDDLINPDLLSHISGIEFDCYADQFHTFYDIMSGKISSQKRSFLPNTCVHKYIHAMAETGPEKIPLLQNDHSMWITYYKDKRLIYTPRAFPVYLRVLSPTTVTNGIYDRSGTVAEIYGNARENASRIQTESDIDRTK